MTELVAVFFLIACAPFVLLAITLTAGGKFLYTLVLLLFSGSPTDGFAYLLGIALTSAFRAGSTFVDVLLYVWSEANTHSLLALMLSGASVYLHLKLLKEQATHPLGLPRRGLTDGLIDILASYIYTCSLVLGSSFLFFGSLSLLAGLAGAVRLAFVETEGTMGNSLFVFFIIIGFVAFILRLGKQQSNVHEVQTKVRKHDGKTDDPS